MLGLPDVEAHRLQAASGTSAGHSPGDWLQPWSEMRAHWHAGTPATCGPGNRRNRSDAKPVPDGLADDG